MKNQDDEGHKGAWRVSETIILHECIRNLLLVVLKF